MNLDSILNVIFFAVGLAIGLLQLYIGQHQFEVQQREKMDELRRLLTDIQQRLAVLEEISSQRTYDVQDKLIRLAAGEEAVAEFTEETVKQVHELVSNELNKAGVHDSIERTKMLENKLSKVLETSAASFVEHATSDTAQSPALTIRETQVLTLIANGKTDREIAENMSMSINTIKVHIRNLFLKLATSNRADLVRVAIANGIIQIENQQDSES